MASGKIFISYRREDTSGESGRLKDNLEVEFGKGAIFYDVETLEAGLNFDQSISLALNECDVLLAMIGPHWLRVTDAHGNPRIQGAEDWVRKEITLALRRNIRVIPILVNGAQMPASENLPDELKELALRNAKELSSSRWNYDVGELVKVLKKLVTSKPTPQPIRPIPIPKNISIPDWTNQYGDWTTTYRAWWSKNYKWVLGFIALMFLYQACNELLYGDF